VSNLKQVTGTGDAITGPCRLLSVSLSHTAAAGVLTIKDGSGGAVFLTMRCAADGSQVWRAVDKSGVQIASTINVASITGTATIEYA